MNPLAFWLDAWLAGLRFWSAALTPRDLPATVTPISEGHAIRARRARQREGRL